MQRHHSQGPGSIRHRAWRATSCRLSGLVCAVCVLLIPWAWTACSSCPEGTLSDDSGHCRAAPAKASAQRVPDASAATDAANPDAQAAEPGATVRDAAAHEPPEPPDSGASATSADPCAAARSGSVCSGKQLHVCADGATSDTQTCKDEQACQLGLSGNECAECEPGSFRCEGRQLERCNHEGSYEPKAKCETAGLCDADKGACAEAACTPEARTCTASGTLRICNADATGYSHSEACGEGLCDDAAGRCNVCQPGRAQCDGDTAVICSADGQSSTTTACQPRSECWTASCSEGNCMQRPKPALRENRCETNKYCDGLGNCVGCVSDLNCAAGETCELGSRTCKKKPCGDGVIGPGESCDPGHPGWSNAMDLCTETCQIRDTIYTERSCGQAQSEIWSGSSMAGWICNGVGMASRVCQNSAQCVTEGGLGACLTYGAMSDYHFCGITCTTPGGTSDCPGELTCYAIPDGANTCGTHAEQR